MSSNDIGALLGQIKSKKAKAEMIFKLAGEEEIPLPDLEAAIAYYEKHWAPSAAEIAEKAGLTDKAIDIYVKKGNFEDAAKVAYKAGDYKRAEELHNKALANCLKNKDIKSAIHIARELRLPEKIVEIYEKAGMLLEAARATLPGHITEMQGDIKKTEIYHGGRYGSVVLQDGKRVTEKSDLEKKGEEMYKKLIEEYEAKGDFINAAKLAEEAGIIDANFTHRAITDYSKAKKWHFGAETAERAGLAALAQELYKKAIEKNRHCENKCEIAARCAREIGQLELAVQIFEENEHYHQAFEIAKEEGLTEKLKELYPKLIDQEERDAKRSKSSYGFAYAGKLAKEAGLDKRAKKLYLKAISMAEKERRVEDAIGYAQQSGLDEVLLALYEKHGWFYEAASLAQRMGLSDKAKAYERLNEISREYRRKNARPGWSQP
ncbi:MAG: hypothetical protein WC471_01210 [Candidatus Woesearchaeota archaeon]